MPGSVHAQVGLERGASLRSAIWGILKKRDVVADDASLRRKVIVELYIWLLLLLLIGAIQLS